MPLVHPEEAERRGQSCEGGRKMVARVPPREHVRGHRRQKVAKDPDEVIGEDWIARDRIDRQAEKADTENMLAVGEGVCLRIKDVGVEEAGHAIEQAVSV